MKLTKITEITVVERTTGRVHRVTNGGTVYVNDKHIKIRVKVKNNWQPGDVCARLWINGLHTDTKDRFADYGETVTFEWNYLMDESELEITAESGHIENIEIRPIAPQPKPITPLPIWKYKVIAGW